MEYFPTGWTTQERSPTSPVTSHSSHSRYAPRTPSPIRSPVLSYHSTSHGRLGEPDYRNDDFSNRHFDWYQNGGTLHRHSAPYGATCSSAMHPIPSSSHPYHADSDRPPISTTPPPLPPLPILLRRSTQSVNGPPATTKKVPLVVRNGTDYGNDSPFVPSTASNGALWIDTTSSNPSSSTAYTLAASPLLPDSPTSTISPTNLPSPNSSASTTPSSRY